MYVQHSYSVTELQLQCHQNTFEVYAEWNVLKYTWNSSTLAQTRIYKTTLV